MCDWFCPVTADDTRHFHHCLFIKVDDRSFVRHDQQHPFLRVISNRSCKVNDVAGVFIHFKRGVSRCLVFYDALAFTKDVFFAASHDFICPCKRWVGVRHFILREKVILQVGIWQSGWINFVYFFCFGKGVHPAGISMLARFDFFWQ